MSFEEALKREFNKSSKFIANVLEPTATFPAAPLELHASPPAAFDSKEISEESPNPTQSNSKSVKTRLPRNHLAVSSTNSVPHQLVQQILCTVGELESTLIEDHEHDFNLRMTLERQIAKVNDLNLSLDNERERNVRLMDLIRGVDSNSSTDEDADGIFSRCGSSELWQARSSDAFESISPLLMQQRYDELSASYKQCRRQLARKDKQLQSNRCETEELRTRFDKLLDEYRNQQQNLEQLCFKYIQLQAKKNHEIQRLREALNCAGDCILNAQQILDSPEEHALREYGHSDRNLTEFKQNLQLFVNALRLCRWVQSSTRRYHHSPQPHKH